ncbi:hypothetical protein EV13_2057 [Prochlorococcus sp. MIT 0702]|nr:hypothetical protein EV13_2057 [Prochlorococcus sp. MIT 0702]KGG28216.1 hypothetical protein EV12_0966 [Prochlorococcus sp. MIT 0701]KGG37267.1 hypothetical protein EV14_0059 [Prochlorococcus sp. MIT 0703]
MTLLTQIFVDTKASNRKRKRLTWIRSTQAMVNIFNAAVVEYVEIMF